MLSNLQKVQDSFYSNQSIQTFMKSYPILEQLKMLNKTNKSQTKSRIKKYFYKITQSNHYKLYLESGFSNDKQTKSQFAKYIASQNSQQYFELLQKKIQDVIILIDNNQQLISPLFYLVHTKQFGIKMIKIISKLYQKYNNHESLFTQKISQQFQLGLESQDSQVQMRFIQIIANIATNGGQSFKFVQKLLQKSLNLYTTDDILLKLNIVQIVSVLGNGVQTAQLLKGHKVWSLVQKDALDVNQQFYVRKSLLLLLINMSIFEKYQMTPKFTKNIIQFLLQCLSKQGQYLQAGLQLSSQLLRSTDTAKIILQNKQLLALFLKQSYTPSQKLKKLFIQCLTSLTDKSNVKKTKAVVINILNCVGNSNLSGDVLNNVNAGHIMTNGIDKFALWFSELLKLPFQDLQLALLDLFYNLLDYEQICESLFEQQQVTKYLLRQISQSNSTKLIRLSKNKLVVKLQQKGKKQWKGTKLAVYAQTLQKQLLKNKTQMEVATQAV